MSNAEVELFTIAYRSSLWDTAQAVTARDREEAENAKRFVRRANRLEDIRGEAARVTKLATEATLGDERRWDQRFLTALNVSDATGESSHYGDCGAHIWLDKAREEWVHVCD